MGATTSWKKESVTQGLLTELQPTFGFTTEANTHLVTRRLTLRGIHRLIYLSDTTLRRTVTGCPAGTRKQQRVCGNGIEDDAQLRNNCVSLILPQL
jgi:hypothetical protein